MTTAHPPGWLTFVTGGSDLTDPSAQAANMIAPLPPPRSVEMSISGERDSAVANAVFDGIIPRGTLQRTAYLLYGGGPLWPMGADDVTYEMVQGDMVTRVVFRIGPYRYGKVSYWAGSRYLYRVVLAQLKDMLQSDALFGPASPNPGSETAAWLWLLSNQDFTASQTDRVLDDLYKHLSRECLLGTLHFDEVVRRLFDRWQILLMIDPNYLSASRYQMEVNLFSDWDNLPEPTFLFRNLMDDISERIRGSQRTGVNPLPSVTPIADDIRFAWPLQMTLREDEDTVLAFFYRGEQVDRAAARANTIDAFANIANDPATGMPYNLMPGTDYWRIQQGDEWTITRDFRTVVNFNAANPWNIYSPYRNPSLYHSQLENHLARRANFFPNRKREATVLAPETAAELRQYLPGNPIRIRSTGESYWITELRVSTPPLTMKLHLVYPGDPWDGDLPADAQAKRAAPAIALPGGGSTPDLNNFPTGDLP